MTPLRRVVLVGGGLCAALLLSACGEKAQVLTASGKKLDGPAWQSAATPYTAAGWKSGDEAGWQAQIHSRNQSQNEYTRAPAQVAAPKAP